MVTHLACGVDITLFSNSFIVIKIKPAVGDPQPKGQFIRFSSTATLVWLTSSFWYLWLHTILAYVTIFLLSLRMLLVVTNFIVYAPLTLPDVPCANLPTPLPKESPHVWLPVLWILHYMSVSRQFRTYQRRTI